MAAAIARPSGRQESPGGAHETERAPPSTRARDAGQQERLLTRHEGERESARMPLSPGTDLFLRYY